MSVTTQPGAPPAGAIPLTINIQYAKDVSFEVPGAPGVYMQPQGQPQVNLNLDVQASRLDPNQQIYEVSLVIRAEAKQTAPPGPNGQAPAPVDESAPTLFVAELTFAGVFTLGAVPENTVEPLLLVEAPRLLFPFARNILADITRDGGFPPVFLQPLDFVALWQSRRAGGAASV
ncbi:MAG: protein-export chaperone SecB [Acetobacteraceae bacterium]|nr:protein-export chaperone SecB [Acetobacteraceae bacterium]MSP30855.1 protein-export chaperone SecB [Acetobacteraceae bacterium]